jgi:hypothetical protein
VKRADLAEVNPDETENENKQPKQPQTTPACTWHAATQHRRAKSGEDVMLKKAIEVLTTGAKAKKRAA